jgi:hypothetical protein
MATGSRRGIEPGQRDLRSNFVGRSGNLAETHGRLHIPRTMARCLVMSRHGSSAEAHTHSACLDMGT